MHTLLPRSYAQVFALALIISLVGCAGGDATNQESSDAAPIKRTEAKTPEPAAASEPATPAPSAAPFEVVQNSALAQQILAVEVSTELPDDAPDDLPVPADLKMIGVTNDKNNGALAYNAEVSGTVEETVADYKKLATDAGWNLEGENTQPPLSMLSFKDGEKLLNVVVIDGGTAPVQVSVTRLEKMVR